MVFNNFRILGVNLANLSLNNSKNNLKLIKNVNTNRYLFTTTQKNDLMEFFDDQKNWGAIEVKSGRSWKKEELRLKSNSDLHKLWYVLLKERNMLLTMEEAANEETRLFPSPERLDKVEESMENLETVVRERNKVYHMLETGESGERPGEVRKGPFGLTTYYKMTEHIMPKFMNTSFKENERLFKFTPNKDTDDFLLKYKEKLYLNKKRQQNRDFNHVIGLLKRFPNMDMEALKEQYPNVDIEKCKASRRYKCHFIPK